MSRLRGFFVISLLPALEKSWSFTSCYIRLPSSADVIVQFYTAFWSIASAALNLHIFLNCGRCFKIILGCRDPGLVLIVKIVSFKDCTRKCQVSCMLFQ